jgi:hypothetical protein
MVSRPGNFAAIEVKPGETPHQAIGILMHLAKAQRILFAGLEVFDTFKVNKTHFVRFRSDLDVSRLRVALLQDRGVILHRSGDTRYEVALPGGVTGNYSSSAMHATPRVTEHRTYRGTSDQFWARQFKV